MTLDVDAGEELLDQEPVVEDDMGDACCHLLVGQVRVLDAGEADLVAVS
jgi:hypothetical protein